MSAAELQALFAVVAAITKLIGDRKAGHLTEADFIAKIDAFTSSCATGDAAADAAAVEAIKTKFGLAT